MADTGLLDTLSGFLSEVAASRQAALGNAAPLQALQEQQKQQNLLDQLQAVSQNDLQGPFGQTLQKQLQFGDLEGAKKTLINLPKYKQAQDVLKNPKLGLSPEDLDSLNVFASVDPEGAIKLGERLVAESKVTKRQIDVNKAQEVRTMAREERAAKRAESKTAGAVITTAINAGELTPDNAEEVLPSLLRRKGVRLPATESERVAFINDLLADPTLKLAPKSTWQKIQSKISGMFGSAPETPAPAQAPVQAQPTAGTIKIKAPSGAVKEFPDTQKNRELATRPGYSIVK
jgi:hypothetical protein